MHTEANRRSAWPRRLLGLLLAGGLLAITLGAVETLAQRRRRVVEMSAEQREELFRNEQHFRALSAEDQQRIRDFHDQLEKAPDREKLRATMNRYCKWFETQPLFRRAKLMDKKDTPKDRIKLVKGFLLKKQGPTKDIRLDDRNRRVLTAWLDRYTAENGTRFIQSMAKDHPGIVKLPPERQKVIVRERLLRLWQAGVPNGDLPITQYEKDRLLAALSPELRTKLKAKEPAEQARIIADLLREAASHELDEELAGFFESQIDEYERDRLMSLPAKEMYDSLSEQYSAHLKQAQSADSPPQGDRGPWPRDRHAGPPRGSGGRRWADNHEKKEPRTAMDSKGNQPSIAPAPPAEKSPAEKRVPENLHPDKPSAVKPAPSPS
jgi:hypothetical protein